MADRLGKREYRELVRWSDIDGAKQLHRERQTPEDRLTDIGGE